jgi:hypothetical protein
MLRKGIAFCLLLFTVACHEHTAPVEDVQKATALFVQRLNAQEFEKIYDGAAKALKDLGRDKVITDLKTVAAKGEIQDYTLVSMPLPEQDKKRLANPVYVLQGGGRLKLSFVDEDGEWKLVGFER